MKRKWHVLLLTTALLGTTCMAMEEADNTFAAAPAASKKTALTPLEVNQEGSKLYKFYTSSDPKTPKEILALHAEAREMYKEGSDHWAKLKGTAGTPGERVSLAPALRKLAKELKAFEKKFEETLTKGGAILSEIVEPSHDLAGDRKLMLVDAIKTFSQPISDKNRKELYSALQQYTKSPESDNQRDWDLSYFFRSGNKLYASHLIPLLRTADDQEALLTSLKGLLAYYKKLGGGNMGGADMITRHNIALFLLNDHPAVYEEYQNEGLLGFNDFMMNKNELQGLKDLYRESSRNPNLSWNIGEEIARTGVLYLPPVERDKILKMVGLSMDSLTQARAQ